MFVPVWVLPDDMPSIYQYSHPIHKAALPNRKTVSDVRLSVFLKHGTEDSCTELLSYTNPKTHITYRLVLQGFVSGWDADGKAVNMHTLTPPRLRKLERDEAAFTLKHNPWFEWVDHHGNTASEPFTSIELDADDEVAAFLGCLGEKNVGYLRPEKMRG